MCIRDRIGDCVEYNTIYASSTSESGLTPSEGFNSGTITRVIPWAVNPYLINNGTGWVNDCCIISSDNSNDEGCDNADIKVGDKVRVILNVDYDTDRAFNLYYDEYDVIQINGCLSLIHISYEKAAGQYGRVADAVKIIDPRTDEEVK